MTLRRRYGRGTLAAQPRGGGGGLRRLRQLRRGRRRRRWPCDGSQPILDGR
jgi:hypothetical protein